MQSKPTVAIIGAGFSGLVLAENINKNAEIKIFEKSRGVGGRMSCRTNNDFAFDFGSQFFLAKTSQFNDFLQPYINKKIIVPWCGKFVEIDKNKIINQRIWSDEKKHFVAAPKMNSLCKEMAINFDIRFQTKITKIEKIKNKWQIYDDKSFFLGEFDWVFFSIPAAQLSDLLLNSKINCSFFERLASHEMIGCYALMLGLNRKINIDFDAALVRNSIISWISCEASKPLRKNVAAYTVLARNNWAQHHLDHDIDLLKNQMIDEFSKIINQPIEGIVHSDIHRWRYANIKKQPTHQKYYIDESNQIAACGDWIIHGRIEAAFMSAKALADNINHNFKLA